MTDKLKGILIAGAAIAALAIGGAAIATAGGGTQPSGSPEAEEANEAEDGGGSEAAEQATGPRADDAARAALDAVGGGRVLEVETADDGMSGFEVEIERDDGSYVEVNLDENLEVVSTGGDD
jgi:uncharacterized membrane protein YkoI